MSRADRYTAEWPGNARPEDLRGHMCDRVGCGKSMRFVHTLAGVGAFCSQACRSGAQPEPFRFTENDQTFICAWHEGFDRSHPANAGASHGICPSCMVKL